MKKAFIAMPFSGDFEEVYESAILPALDSKGYSAIRVDQLRVGSNIIDDIHSNIISSDIVIVEATEANRNVYYELGLAQGYGKQVMILARKGTALPFDTMTVRHIFYDAEDYISAEREIASWLDTSAAASKIVRRGVLYRGENSSDLIDAATAKRWAKISLREELLNNIRRGSMISCGYSYGCEIGAQSWLNLCRDPLYDIYSDSVRNIRDGLGDLFNAIDPKKINEVPDVVSLGPGDGAKDKIILDFLNRLWKKENIPHQSNYYPVDVSQLIIATAVQNVLSSKSLAERFRVKSINGSFEQLSVFDPVFNYRTSSNIFLFLGNTLGNYNNETEILSGIANCMSPNDVLFLEVRRKQPGHILLSGHNDNQFALSVSPLLYLGVNYEAEKVSQRLTSGFSQIPGTESIMVSYKSAVIQGEEFRNIPLSCVNFYDESSLIANVETSEIGLKVVSSSSSDRMIFLLLEKS